MDLYKVWFVLSDFIPIFVFLSIIERERGRLHLSRHCIVCLGPMTAGRERRWNSELIDFLISLSYDCRTTSIKANLSNPTGVMNPPVLVDLNKDGTVDIVISYFNSTTVAVDGENFNRIWSYSVPNSESYS